MKQMKKYFLKDSSLNNIDDDKFRYQDFANNLSKIIEYNEAPFNVAIVGKWGLGKSSLVNMALAPLRKKEKEFLVCDINAWKYEKDEIGKAFLKELWEKISKKKVLSFNFFHKDYSDIVKTMFDDGKDQSNKNVGLLKFLVYAGITVVVSIIAFAIYCGISNKFYGIKFSGESFWASTILRYCKNIGSILIIPLVVWLGKLFMDKINGPAYKNYEITFPLETQADYEIYLTNLLQGYFGNNKNKKIVVVIDDLDRLSADKIVEALDALKLFMEYDQFIFIVPFDDEILKNALKQKRINDISALDNDYDGEMVLDKIFQYKIFLPQLIKYDMRNYAFEICKNDCIDFISEYCNGDYKLFEEIVGKILIHSNVSTPRQVKKIINTFIENVMICRDREQAKKVGVGFVTEKKGLETIAKISVLQSDFNEFYDLLFNDANAVMEILLVHRNKGDLPPGKLLINYFDDNNLLRREYESLVNYLIFTENLGHSNIMPYLYMSQSKAGALVGDNKQQDFVSAIESCNFVTVKQFIIESPILCSLLIEQLKYDESPLMGNIILSAIDCYDDISDDSKQELASAIADRIPTLLNSSNDFRYELLNEENLMAVCHAENSKAYNSLIECAISISHQDSNYKNRVILINKISNIRNELADTTIDKFEHFTREWIDSDESAVQDIIKYTEEQGVEYIAEIYGEDYIWKISNHITKNDDFDKKLVNQFGTVIRTFLENNSLTKIMEDILPCYDYPILHDVLDQSINKDKYSEIDDARDIALKIVSAGVENLKGVAGYNILSKISYMIEGEEDKLFDAFFKDTTGENEFADMILAFAENNSVEMLPGTINTLSEYSLQNSGYAPGIRKLLKLYGKEQAANYWKKLENACKYSSSAEYDSTLLVELSKDAQYDENVISIIANTIIPQASSYYSKSEYLLFVIQVIGAYKNKVDQSDIDEYSQVLLKAMSTDTDSVINAYRVVNNLISESTWCNNIGTLISYITQKTYAVIYDIITERIDLFESEDGNLVELLDFLIDYIDFSNNPDDVINQLNDYFISIINIDKLISKLMNIEYDEDNASVKLAQFIDASEVKTIIRIIIDECKLDDKNKEKLTKLLSNSEKYSKEALVNCISENKEAINEDEILSILGFCEGAIIESNIKSLVDVFSYLLEYYPKKDIYTQILLLISNLSQKSINYDKKGICEILVNIFRQSTSDENRRKSAILMKDKGLGKNIRSMLNEKEMSEYKAYLE